MVKHTITEIGLTILTIIYYSQIQSRGTQHHVTCKVIHEYSEQPRAMGSRLCGIKRVRYPAVLAGETEMACLNNNSMGWCYGLNGTPHQKKNSCQNLIAHVTVLGGEALKIIRS